MGALKISLLILVLLCLGACGPALDFSNPIPGQDGISISHESAGQGSAPTAAAQGSDGTVGSQVETANLQCHTTVEFRFADERQQVLLEPWVRTIPFHLFWQKIGILISTLDGGNPGALTSCQYCEDHVLRVIYLGTFEERSLNLNGVARGWFSSLFAGDNLDQIDLSEAFYQDFEIHQARVDLMDFDFEINGHYLFFLVEDSPEAFVELGEKSLAPREFRDLEELERHLASCVEPVIIRALRFKPLSINLNRVIP